MSAYFITGTDTDVGKTVVATALLKHFNNKGLSTAGFKPIAAGCEQSGNGLQNADALHLWRNSSAHLTYEQVNPFAFEPPIAPHIAAKLVGQTLTVDKLSQAYQPIKAQNSDVIVVEGAGGWCLPINDETFLYQWVEREQFAVILVVGIKLGCLNHALLTQAFILSQGLKIRGWVANIVAPETLHIDENIATLKRQMSAPLLATVPFLEGKSEGADFEELNFKFNF
jgi:dethiobiotin synthetase